MRLFACGCVLIVWAGSLAAAGVKVRFDPGAPDVGPYPTDFLTVPDAAQKTGVRINLPSPDCAANRVVCEENAAINQLDGFPIQTRVRVRFSGDIIPDSLRAGVWYVALENLTSEEYGLKRDLDVTPINQPVWDTLTKTAFARPDDYLDQHRRFALIVTDGVRDARGDAVEPDPAFLACVDSPSNDYCRLLARTVARVAPLFELRRIVAASVFTTMSATTWLEKARRALAASPTGLSREGPRNVFSIADLDSITFHEQTAAGRFEDTSLPMFVYGGIGRVAFGSYSSPSFLDQNQLIPAQPTGSEVSLPAAATEVKFHAFLPPSAMPPNGYPVVIFGHGFGVHRFFSPELIGSTLAQAGFAIVAINAIGHGGGPQGTVELRDTSGNSVILPGGGRGVDVDGDGAYGPVEGCLLLFPAFGTRDCLRQTVLDQMQLVRVIQAGADLDGDGKPDLDPNRIYYVGQSLGAIYGTILNAIEPDIRAAALNSGGGSFVDVARAAPVYRPIVNAYLAARDPKLLNAGSEFQENIPLRYRPALVNSTPGAIALQEVLERLEWLQTSGDPLSYATHLLSSTLPGVPIKSVFWSYGIGDQSVPNPQQTALVRAANMRETTRIYRHDIARAGSPALDKNPHTYLLNLLPPATLIALAAQSQVAGFLASDGLLIPDPPDLYKTLFEAPDFLTEDYNFQP
jgi:hypothetical protein